MKILFATMQYGRGYSQGTERYLSLLAAELRKQGHETVFLAGDPERRGASGQASRLHVTDDSGNLGDVIERDPLVLACPSSGWMTVRGLGAGTLASFVREIKPDLIHVANPGHIGVGILDAARQGGIPAIVSVVDFWWLCPKHTLHHFGGGVCEGDIPWRECLRCIATTHESRILRSIASIGPLRTIALPTLMFGNARFGGLPTDEIPLWKRRREITLGALKQADAVIFLSRTAESLLRPQLGDVRCRVIQNGLEPSWFAPRLSPRVVKQRPEDLRIGYAGALAPHKGVHVLLEAIRVNQWRKSQVRIAAAATENAYFEQLKRLAAGLNVEFVGRVSPEAMPGFLDDIDMLVVPSLWPENVPMAVLESCARGTPVLASDMPGIAELFDDRSLLFTPGSAAALAQRLREFCSRSESLRVPTVRGAREMAADTEAVYQEVLKSGRAPAIRKH